mgnify:CR=1 FL=1|jgi:hypothetical protein
MPRSPARRPDSNPARHCTRDGRGFDIRSRFRPPVVPAAASAWRHVPPATPRTNASKHSECAGNPHGTSQTSGAGNFCSPRLRQDPGFHLRPRPALSSFVLRPSASADRAPDADRRPTFTSFRDCSEIMSSSHVARDTVEAHDARALFQTNPRPMRSPCAWSSINCAHTRRICLPDSHRISASSRGTFWLPIKAREPESPSSAVASAH